VGLTCAALSQALRQRWTGAGALLAGAALSKQFAVLALPAVVLAAPSCRARARVGGAFVGVCLVVLTPFVLADAGATWTALSGTEGGTTVVRSATVVGLLGVGEHVKLQVARDGPVLLAVVGSLVLWRRRRLRLDRPATLVGLVLACMALRLLLEVSVYDYYLLAVAVFLLLVDLVRGRLPLAALAWVCVVRIALLPAGPHLAAGWLAAALVVAALAPTAVGVLSGSRRPP
jgi:hypothetical protein